MKGGAYLLESEDVGTRVPKDFNVPARRIRVVDVPARFMFSGCLATNCNRIHQSLNSLG
jgi:hypothetical protein